MAVVLAPSLAFDQIVVPHPDGFDVILVHEDGVVHAYRNQCPHVGVSLDWGDGRCLAAPGVLRCALHGATFATATGTCTDGPCRGDALTRVPVQVVDGQVVCG